MTLTKKEKIYKRRLRAALKRKLKIGGGHCQVNVKGFGGWAYKRDKRGHYIEERPNCKERQRVYEIAAQLREEYGGEIWTRTYRNRQGYDNCARVYQF